MNIEPILQSQLYGFEREFNDLVNLFNSNKLPNKILLSGPKGSGKCTFAYHLMNYILSLKEDFSYALDDLKINIENKSHKLFINKTSPNFFSIDVSKEKKSVDINQIRILINNLNKSSLNSKPRFVLIDNIEFLNVSSVNALLKIIEEPNNNVFFILIANNKRILPTLKSRCLIFKLSLSFKKSIEITNKIIDGNIFELLNDDYINHYSTPGYMINLLHYSQTHNIDLFNLRLKDFIEFLIKDNHFKKSNLANEILYNLIQFFLRTKLSSINFDYYQVFLRKINITRTYNLDEESLLMEFQRNYLNA